MQHHPFPEESKGKDKENQGENWKGLEKGGRLPEKVGKKENYGVSKENPGT